ncbi:hypothetical protein [Coleofasciculus sp. FACHB-1120]|uniref:hypothetical protein n=1 Tax=Coleofasciculus sp. FACHB-1120 TaxID=2692783 RepID=UPI001683D15D|nr:hypothetical protein [Coleofasciculus sp. FACHB-1120]MBD2740241.1 hypothetical protein [Coleofasciculus sp. FACHB-1120]
MYRFLRLLWMRRRDRIHSTKVRSLSPVPQAIMYWKGYSMRESPTMSNQTTFTDASTNLGELCDWVVADREREVAIVNRESR